MCVSGSQTQAALYMYTYGDTHMYMYIHASVYVLAIVTCIINNGHYYYYCGKYALIRGNTPSWIVALLRVHCNDVCTDLDNSTLCVRNLHIVVVCFQVLHSSQNAGKHKLEASDFNRMFGSVLFENLKSNHSLTLIAYLISTHEMMFT